MHNDRKQILRNRLPILKWVPTYRLSYLFYDFIAGLTVGLTAIPQGIAYAIVAGLPPQYGLYSGFIGSFVYLIFGSSKDVTIGKYSHFFDIFDRFTKFWSFLALSKRANGNFITANPTICRRKYRLCHISNARQRRIDLRLRYAEFRLFSSIHISAGK